MIASLPLGSFRGIDSIRPAVWILIWSPVPVLITLGYRFGRRRYEPSAREDARKPILFLGPSDHASRTSLQPTGPLAIFAGVRSGFGTWDTYYEDPELPSEQIKLRKILLDAYPIRLLRMLANHEVENTEESLLRYFESFGPVIAIGSNGEATPIPGSTPSDVEDEKRRESIRDALRRSQAVVIQPGSSTGVRWELEQIRAGLEPSRALLCLVNYRRNPQGYEDLTSVVRESLRVELPRVVPFLDRAAFIEFDPRWLPQVQLLSYRCPCSWPFDANAADLKYTLQPFTQGLNGGQREAPRPPRWVRGPATVTAGVLACGIALFVSWIFIFSMNSAAQFVRLFAGLPPSPIRRENHEVSALSSTDAVKSAQPIPELVARSRRITLSGRSVPYHLNIPEAMIKKNPDKEIIEYWRKSPDGALSIQVLAHDQPEDLSTAAKDRLELNRVEGVTEVNLDGARTVNRSGVDWIEAEISLKMNDGGTAKELFRATSDERGTVFVVIHVMGTPAERRTYLTVAQETLSSIRLDRPARSSGKTAPAKSQREPDSNNSLANARTPQQR